MNSKTFRNIKATAPLNNERVYHVRQKTIKDNFIVGTVCILEMGDGVFCRGISIVSINDTGSKKAGRHIAINRARKAALTKHTNSTMNMESGYESVNLFQACWSGDSKSKSEYNCQLTKFEKRLFNTEERA